MGKLLKFPERNPNPGEAGQSGLAAGTVAARALPEELEPEFPNVIPLDGCDQDLPDFSTFHRKILEGDLVSAGELLSFLLGVTHFQGIESARAYRFLNRRTSQAEARVRSLFESLAAGKSNECLMFLSDCFGIEGARAVLVLQHLKAQS